MEPDGSLCRITSSYKDFVNNVRIVRKPGSDPCIRLELMKLDDESEESEKSSEISDSSQSDDEELCNIKTSTKRDDEELGNVKTFTKSDDEELHNVKTSTKSADKNSGTDIKIDNSNESKKDKRIERKHGHNYRSQTSFKRNYYKHRGNNFNKTNRSSKSKVPNLKRDYNYSKRDYNHPVAHNTPIQHPSDEISPWIDPSAMHNFQCSTYTVASHPENARNSVGLLGDRPLYIPLLNDQSLVYFPVSTNFQPNSNRENPNSPYSSMIPNFASNHNSLQENQNASYSQMSSHYPSNNLTNNQNYGNNNYRSHNKNHWGRNRGRNQYKGKQSWNKNRRGHPNV